MPSNCIDVSPVAAIFITDSPVPVTAMVVLVVLPDTPTFPVLAPIDCGENLTYIGVDAKVADVYGIVVELPQVVLLFETWKSVLGAFTVTTPGKLIRSVPVILDVWDGELYPTGSPSNGFIGVAASAGVFTPFPDAGISTGTVTPPPVICKLVERAPTD